MADEQHISQSLLRELFDYDPETGFLTRLITVTSSAKSGAVAGCLYSGGYLMVAIKKKRYLVHRIIWFYMYGRWPNETIDHVNNVKTDNRWVNLREATYSQNNWNRSIQRRNTSGVTGVYFEKEQQKWRAIINANGRKHCLGSFVTKEEAASARLAAETIFHGAFACQR